MSWGTAQLDSISVAPSATRTKTRANTREGSENGLPMTNAASEKHMVMYIKIQMRMTEADDRL
ncbi:MAG: hypothetical protein OSA92_11680 [Pirellulaceae bacterium]|nr:hypothetical protein [Pirellulaceae bacterium]